MKRMGAWLLALLLLLGLCACAPRPAEPGTASAPPAETAPPQAPETAPPSAPATPEPTPDPVQLLTESEERFLAAARQGVARACDSEWRGCSHDGETLTAYYAGDPEAEATDSGLLRRAMAVAAVEYDPDRLKTEGGRVLYLATFPGGEDWEDRWVELDPEEPGGEPVSVSLGFVTAQLREGRVYLSFDDTAEAANCLLGEGDPELDYHELGREQEIPGDNMALGPDHLYEVRGLYSRYKDIFLGDLGGGGTWSPYLFLVTCEDGLEMVDVAGGFRYGLFCAMPVPGTFRAGSLSAGAVRDDGGSRTVIATDSLGAVCDMSECVRYAWLALPQGEWSGWAADSADGEEITAELSVDAPYIDFALNEAEEPVGGGFVTDAAALGMTEAGIVCGCTWYSWDGMLTGAFAWSVSTAASGETVSEELRLEPLTGPSPFPLEEEALSLWRWYAREEPVWDEDMDWED